MNPLPSVESACSLLQQEKSQRDALSGQTVESTALYSRGNVNVKDKCSFCGQKWHPPEKCWEKVGYPTWHYKYKFQNQSKQQQFKPKGKDTHGHKKIAATAEGGNVVFTSQQFEQLMKSISQFDHEGKGGDTDEDIDLTFAAGITSLFSDANSHMFREWILDTSATDHMTPISSNLSHAKKLAFQPTINLPNGFTSIISHIGNVMLVNGIVFKNTLLVPSFKFSLLSIRN